MSYCRWSSDGFRCDIYLYNHCDGYYSLNIAGRKIVGNLPERPDLDLLTKGNAEDFARLHRNFMDAANKAKREIITLPYAGETFNIYSPKEVYDKLIELRKLGYNFPDYVLDEVRDEIVEI